jgi:hypothetical protein
LGYGRFAAPPRSMPGSLTAEFPDDREPERKPEVSADFEAASFTDEQAKQDQEKLDHLESQRAAPKVQGMDYTPGGEIEQAVHENVEAEREAEIASLESRIDRHRQRGRGR